MLQYEITLLPFVMAVISACLTLLINYCIGNPGSDKFSPYEIFSSYSVWLSVRRLKHVGLHKDYEKQYYENLNRTNFKHEIITLKNEYKKMIYDAADPFFTWERAIGMCPVCTGVWVSGIWATLFSNNIVDLLFIIVVSHVVIRILNKII